MADWAKEIMILANDFCLNMAKAKEIVTEVENVTVPIADDACPLVIPKIITNLSKSLPVASSILIAS